MAVSGFMAPILLALGLLFLLVAQGLQPEQVARAITGVRFSRLYGQMTHRMNHLRQTHLLWRSQAPGVGDTTIKNINDRRPARGSQLGSRLLGVSDNQIHRQLLGSPVDGGLGYEATYDRVRWRNRLTGFVDSNGKPVLDFSKGSDQSKVAQLNDLETRLRSEYSDQGKGDLRARFMARRSVRYLAYQGGIKLFRFRSAMDKIRQKIRGPPRVAEASKELPVDSMNDKTSVRTRIFSRLGRAGLVIGGLFNITERKIKDIQARWANKDPGLIQRTKNRISLKREKIVDEHASKVGRALGWTRAGSIFMLVATSFCTAFELVNMVRDLAQLQIAQQADEAAKLFTVVGQARAGEVEPEVVNQVSHQFDGFANSTNYQVLYGNVIEQDEGKLEATLKYINRHFNLRQSFGVIFNVLNFFITKVFKGLHFVIKQDIRVKLGDELLKPLGWGIELLGDIPGLGNLLGGLPFLGGFFSGEKELSVSALVWRVIGEMANQCKNLLIPAVQITAGVVLTLLEVILTFISGGVWAAVKAALTGLIQTVALTIAVSAVSSKLHLDDVVAQHLMPEMVGIATGISSEFSNEPGSGAENYIKADLGAHHLSDAQALAEGAGLISSEQAVLQDQFYIAQYRQDYIDQGIWSNIANPKNPYSSLAKLQSWLPANVLRSQPEQVRSAAGWIASNQTGWVDPTGAEVLTTSQLAELLYPNRGVRAVIDTSEDKEIGDEDIKSGDINPDSYLTLVDEGLGGEVVGFYDYEVSGEGDFNFETNSLYVENEKGVENLRQSYGHCLGITVSELRLYQAGITQPVLNKFGQDREGGSYYPANCKEPDARRYMIYYQDCLHVSDLRRLGTNYSPMLSTECDHLLPDDGFRGTDADQPQPEDLTSYEQIDLDLPQSVGSELDVDFVQQSVSSAPYDNPEIIKQSAAWSLMALWNG